MVLIQPKFIIGCVALASFPDNSIGPHTNYRSALRTQWPHPPAFAAPERHQSLNQRPASPEPGRIVALDTPRHIITHEL